MQKIINKREIVEKVASEGKVSLMNAELIVDCIFDLIRKGVDADHKISIGGFGIFRRKVRVSRMCRNPRTGEKVLVGDIHVVKFTPATAFKELIK